MGSTTKDDLGSDSIRPGHAPLMTKVLNRLVAMGKAKPKTISSLTKALQSCTPIIPHMNPLDALKIVNDQSDKLPPQVVTEQVAPVYTRVDKVNQTFWELAEHDRSLTGHYFKYPPPVVKRALLKRAWKWLNSEPEGTEESLLHELYPMCKMEHSEEPREIIKNLQQMGFVNIDERGVVTYHLPRHSDVLELRGVLGTQLAVLRLYQFTQTKHDFGGYVHQVTYRNNSYYKWNTYSSDTNDGVKTTFRVGKTTFSFGVDLADVQALFLLDGVKPKARPREVSDLLEFIKPACTYLHLIIPSQMFVELGKKLQQRPVLEVRIKQNQKRGLKSRLMEFVIGKSEKQRKTIPLTPEGLLGLDGISPRVGGNRESDVTELETVGRSKQFASMLKSHLTSLMQSQGAVLFEVTDDQMSEILNEVSKWIDSYRLLDNATKEENQGVDDEEEAPSKAEIETKPSIARLQRELIAICNTCKVTRLPMETVVTLLQNYGFISVDENRNSISYNIPNVSDTKDSVPYWQVQADKYRKSSVEQCYSSFLYRYFPRVRGRRRQGGDKLQPKAEPAVIFASKPILSTKIKQFLFGFIFFWMIAFVSFFSYGIFFEKKTN